MAEQAALGFAGLLRQLRAAARLTQDELAEAAEVSPRTVSDLERGINRTARKDTAELLATAMGLTGREREQFLAAARGKPARPGGRTGPTAAEAFPAAPGECAGRGGTGERQTTGRLEPGVAGLRGHRELRRARAGARRLAGGMVPRDGRPPRAGARRRGAGNREDGAHRRVGPARAGRRGPGALRALGRATSSLRIRRSVRRWPITRGPAPRHCCAMIWATWPGKSPGCARSRRSGSAPLPPSPWWRPRPSASGCSSRLTRGSSGWGHGIPCCLSSTTCNGRTCPPSSCSPHLMQARRSTPLLAVAMYRDIEPERSDLSAVLHSLARDVDCRRLTLRGLERELSPRCWRPRPAGSSVNASRDGRGT